MRILALFMAVLLGATACGSNDSGVAAPVVPGAADSAPGEVGSDGADSGAAEVETNALANEAPEPAAPEPAEVADGEPTCGQGQDLSPEAVGVEQIDGDDRDSNPSALVGDSHPQWPASLIPVDDIISGGPPPDGIPPIDTPRFQTASSVDWLSCNEPVLSLVIDGDARAYPVQVMTWHELVNDTFGDRPVTVSFCPLCNSALAYDRRVNERILDFGTSGRLFNSSLVMYDRQTESLWTHFNGAAVVGTLAGTELDLLPMQTTSWKNFLRQNPDGIVLTRETGFQRSYGINPYEGYDDVNTSPFLFQGDIDDRLAAKERVVAIDIADDSVAVVLEHLSAEQVIAIDIGGQPVTIWHLPGTASALETNRIDEGRDVGTTGVYDPSVDGQQLTFSRNDDGTFVDAETGSRWDIGGVAIDGSLAGTRLRGIERIDTFWFAIAAFAPDTRVIA